MFWGQGQTGRYGEIWGENPTRKVLTGFSSGCLGGDLLTYELIEPVVDPAF